MPDLKIEEAAQVLGCRADYVYDLIRDGLLEAEPRTYWSHYHIKPEAIERLLNPEVRAEMLADQMSRKNKRGRILKALAQIGAKHSPQDGATSEVMSASPPKESIAASVVTQFLTAPLNALRPARSTVATVARVLNRPELIIRELIATKFIRAEWACQWLVHPEEIRRVSVLTLPKKLSQPSIETDEQLAEMAREQREAKAAIKGKKQRMRDVGNGYRSRSDDDSGELPETMTADEAAKLLHCGRQRIYQAIAAGEVRGVKALGKWLVYVDSIRRLLGVRSPSKKQRSNRGGVSPEVRDAVARIDPKLLIEDDDF